MGSKYYNSNQAGFYQIFRDCPEGYADYVGLYTYGATSNNGEFSVERKVRPVVIFPKSSYVLKDGGLHGEDYHIEPSDQTVSGTTREIGEYKQMTPTNYTRTGESIDYVPNPPETSKILEYELGMSEPYFTWPGGSMEDYQLAWKIWGEDNENIYLISENPTKPKFVVTR